MRHFSLFKAEIFFSVLLFLLPAYFGFAQAPGDVDGGNLNLWLKADANVEEADGTAAEDGDGVDDWRDQTANNLDASQGTADARPTFNTNQVNGYPSITFSTAGTDDFLDLGNVLNFDPSADDWSVFIIYNVIVNEQGTLFSRALSGTGATRPIPILCFWK